MGITTVPTKRRPGSRDLANSNNSGLPVLLWMLFSPGLLLLLPSQEDPHIPIMPVDEVEWAGSLTHVCLSPSFQASAACLKQLQQGIQDPKEGLEFLAW